MLKKSGGEKRVKKFSLEKKTFVNAKKIRNLKTLIFNNYLKKNKLKPRAGVINVIKYCKKNKIKICFVTSTTKNNIDAVFISLKKKKVSKLDIFSSILIYNYASDVAWSNYSWFV